MAGTIGLIIIGIIVIVFAIRVLNNFKLIRKEGIEVEGIIFEFEQSTSTGTSVSYPIVRFLTQKNEWVTQKSTIGVIPGMYKKGEKISILYQKNNPNKFYIKNKKTYVVPFIMIAVALVILLLGTLKLMDVIS